MKTKVKIYDADRHLIEPIDIWEKYVEHEIYKDSPIVLDHDNDLALQKRVERLGTQAGIRLPPTITMDDKPVLLNWSENIQLASAHKNADSISQRRAAMDPYQQLSAMDNSDVDIARIFPSFAIAIVNNDNLAPKVSVAYADAYNRWLKDYCSINTQRLKPVGLISRHDPVSMVLQLEKIIGYGWNCITLRPEVIKQRVIGHPDYDVFWALCAQRGIAVALHGGTHVNLPSAGVDRFDSRFALHACSHPIELQMAFVSLLESGVFERYPTLKFAFIEAGASWLPSWLWRLDNICYPEFPSLVKDNIKILPSEYFKRQCWITMELGEPCLRQVIDMVGHKRLLYGSDFPHPDHLHFTTANIANQLSELSHIELTDILTNNAEDFFDGNKSHSTQEAIEVS